MSQDVSVAAKGASAIKFEHAESGLSKVLSFGFTLGASLGAFGFFAVQGILLARMLGPDQRGAFAVAVMFPQALLYLGLLGAPELFAGYAAQGMRSAPLRRSAARYGLFAGIVSAAVCILLNLITIPSGMRSVLPLAVLCALTMPLQQIRLAVQAVDHGQRALTRYNHVRLTAAGIFPALLLLAFAMGGADLTTVCILFFAAQFLSLGLAQLGMRESWLGTSAVPVRKALVEAKGLMGAWFSAELLERLDLVLMMLLVANESELGFYAAAIPVAALLIIAPGAVGLYAFNRGARSDEQLTTRSAWQFLAIGLSMQAVSALLLAAALPWLIPAFYGADFSPTIGFAWLLLPAGVFRGLLLACDSYLRARKKPGVGVRARAVGIPILLSVSFFAEPWLGPQAIPIGLSVAQLVCFVIVALAVIAETKSAAPSPFPGVACPP